MQGDITHIYRKDEYELVQVAHYAYDAFGNTAILQGNESLSSIANINPFRYRGYYYDTETGLYYLISRYYDPETGRFISADSIEYLDPETLGGLNLYAYCLNNPTMNTDPEGTNIADDVSSLFDILFFVAKMGIGTIQGLSINLRGVGKIVKGVGSSAKAFANNLGRLGGKIPGISTVVSYACIAISNIIEGVQSGKSALNIATDTVFDFAALSLGNLIGTGIGAAIDIFAPGVGTLIGSGISLGLNILYMKFESSEIIQDMKQGFYEGVNTVVTAIESAAQSVCNFIESAVQSVGNWFRSLFSW